MTEPEIRVGDAYQAAVPAGIAPDECRERDDQLLWAPASMEAEAAVGAWAAFVESALPLVGGPAANPPTSSSAQQLFALEHVLYATHRCCVDARASGGGGAPSREAVLAAIEAAPREAEWSKVEERHFRSAFAKHKDDVVGINYCVKSRSFGEVVRFFFVEEGMRKKAERERKRELEQLKLSRARPDPTGAAARAAAASAAATTAEAAPDASLDVEPSEAALPPPAGADASRASTPYSQEAQVGS